MWPPWHLTRSRQINNSPSAYNYIINKRFFQHYFDCFEINCTGWCELKNLKQLDLAENNLGGSLPYCLGNLSSLQLLDVSGNQFTGNIASSPLTNLVSLEFLSLSNNLFEVPISMKPFMNHSSLKFFSSENNRLVTEPATVDHLIPKFQLVFLRLSKATEAFHVEIPDFLYYQYN